MLQKAKEAQGNPHYTCLLCICFIEIHCLAYDVLMLRKEYLVCIWGVCVYGWGVCVKKRGGSETGVKKIRRLRMGFLECVTH